MAMMVAAPVTLSKLNELEVSLNSVIRGKAEVVRLSVVCLLARGHLLIEDVPGVGKTTLAQALARSVHCRFHRLQFTSDMLPSDVLGVTIYNAHSQEFQFKRGPVFTNFLLADEINRATTKTLSALLEAMQEHRVTVAGRFFPLPAPFFVLATQNPIEQEGTYPLPEAQLDRFMFFIHVDYPNREEEGRIARETTGATPPELSKVIDGGQIIGFQEVVQRVPVPDHIYDLAVDLVRRTRPRSDQSPEWIKKWVTWGAGPRAVQYLVRGAKARAVLHGSYLVRLEDLEAVAAPVLTHRILTNFQAQSEGVSSIDIINRGDQRRG